MVHFKNPHAYLLSHLKFALIKRNFYFTVHLPKASLPLLRLLKTLNVVRRFYPISTRTFQIFPTYSKLGYALRSLKLFYRLRNPIRIRLKALSLIALFSSASILVLETSEGVLTHHEALKRRLGGTLLCTIL